MRKMLLICLLLIPINLIAKSKWEAHEYILQGTFTILTIIDLSQTRYFLDLPPFYENGYIYEHKESNPILGEEPSKLKLYSYNAICIIGHVAISYILPKPYRTLWQFIWIGIQVETVHHNYQSIGFKLKF